MTDPAGHTNLANPLPVPPHYDPEKVSEVWRVPYQQRAEEALHWTKRYNLQPASQDKIKIALIAVDVQNTFCIPDFELFVAGRSGIGAIEDNRHLSEFIYRNLGLLSHITLTMDTHQALQIFHQDFLVDSDGEHPAPFTLVSSQEIEAGRWKFNPDIASSLDISVEAGQEHLLHYTRELMKQQRYNLTIWPYHAMLGGIGHALVSSIEEAVFFHTIARKTQPDFVIKGQYVTTESYSAIGPEILASPAGDRIAEKSETFLRKVSEFDVVVIAGEAKSHCVAWTIEDLLDQIQNLDPDLTQKVYLLEDCSSPVVIPGVVDYTDQANAAYQRFSEAGIHIVRSTDSITRWPGI